MHLQQEDTLINSRDTIMTSSKVTQEYAAEELRDALIAGVITGTILTPVTHIELLKVTIKAATKIINAEYGTLFRFDAHTQELVFEASEGGAAKDLKQFRMPATQGIAGHVAQTRQPLLVNDVAHNKHWNIKVGMHVMFAPRNILCVPLLWGEKLIGVLQVCDKADAKMFTEADSKTLQLFASQAAVSVGLSISHQSVMSLVATMLEECTGISKAQKESLRQQAFSLTQFTRNDPQYEKMLGLSQLIQSQVSYRENIPLFQKFSVASRIFWQLIRR